MLLDEIVLHKRSEVKKLKRSQTIKDFEAVIEAERSASISFRDQLERKGVRLICEMKKSSPSEGLMKRVYLPRKIAAQFERGGASAISVLTDQKYFQGSLQTIRHIRAVTKLPILRKDFLIDEYQIYESRAAGANAILLIVSILPDKTLARFIKVAKSLGLDALVEAHDKEEVKRAVDAGARLIGINNRNLDTLKINVKHAEQLIGQIPKNITKVVESGIHTERDIKNYQKMGVHAFLIGTALMKSNCIESKIREFLGHHG